VQKLMAVVVGLALALGMAPVGPVAPEAAQARPAGWKLVGKYHTYKAACHKAQRLKEKGYQVMVQQQGNCWCVYCR
jgi:hypothetical protein